MEYNRTERHDTYGKCNREFQSLIYPALVSRTVIICKYRYKSVVETEYRHKEKALQLEVHAEYGSRRVREPDQDPVHHVRHQRADRHHQYGRHADLINAADDLRIRL